MLNQIFDKVSSAKRLVKRFFYDENRNNAINIFLLKNQWWNRW